MNCLFMTLRVQDVIICILFTLYNYSRLSVDCNSVQVNIRSDTWFADETTQWYASGFTLCAVDTDLMWALVWNV